ncbi:unnamed protein product [Spirodela intermedia]|uniref:Uncharacterized protein n=1 Tax=Spirodela intermedia TaxID=51605 RepID=A0A7I8L819_SPIIN|nr:unnamed protein product [Spirodela intermedia]
MHPQPNSLRSLMEYETRETERGNLVQPSEVASEGKAVAEEATPGRRGGSSCGRGPPVIGSYVTKNFPDGVRTLLGKVVSSGGRFFAAVYEDGRREELELCEIRRMLLPSPVDDALEEELVLRKRKLEEILSGGGTCARSSRRKVDPLTARASAAAATTAEGTERRGRHLSGLLVEEDVDSSTDSCESISAPTCNPALPQSMPLQALALPPSSGNIGIPEESVGCLLSVYSFLRTFSTQLFLSPFGLDDFVGSLNCINQNSLLDSIHVSLMRALWRHLEVLSSDGDQAASRCLRYFDWTMLDTLTWPVFALEYFYLMGCIKGPDWKGFRYGITDKEYCSLPATMKLRILQILCDAVLESRELRSELETREDMDEEGEYFTGISPPQANLRMVHSRYFRTPTRRDLQMLDGAIAPEESTSSSNNLSTDADMPNPSNDGNSDECRLCGMDGTLVCCDGCPSAYHSRCIGLMKASLPDGPWYCPECVVNQIAPTYAKIGTGIRGAEMFGTDPYGRAFMGTCNYLLVLEASSNIERVSRYYDQNDVPKVLRLVCSAEEYSSLYADICKEIAKHWAVPMDENCLQPERNGSAVTLQKQDSRGVKFLCDSAGKTDININADRENVSTITRSTVDNRALSNLDGDLVRVVVNDSDSVNQVDLSKTKMFFKETFDSYVKKLTERANDAVTVVRRNQFCSAIADDVGQKVQECSHEKSPQRIENESGLSFRSFSQPTGLTDLIHQRSNDKSSMLNFGCTSRNGNVAFRDDADSQVLASYGDRTRMSHGSLVDNCVHGGKSREETNGNLILGIVFNPQAYSNQYVLGDVAASAAASLASLALEESTSVIHASYSHRKVVSANIAMQLKAFSRASMRFIWTNSEKKLMESPRERCGWCIACKGATINKKGCLLNLASANAAKGAVRGQASNRPIRKSESHISAIATHILNMEEHLYGLILGPFADAKYNKRWRMLVREASTCGVLKLLLLELEKNIRGIAFSADWFMLFDDWLVEFPAAHARRGVVMPIQKRGPGRPRKTPAASETTLLPEVESSNDIYWWRGGRVSRILFQRGILYRSLAKKAARQGGLKCIWGINYSWNLNNPRTKQFAWRAAVEMSRSAAQLALQVRRLDAHIRWKDLVRPDLMPSEGRATESETSAFRNAVISGKQVVENKIRYALAFGGQRHLPSCVMKNVLEVETDQDGKERLWFSENNVPLYLIKENEENGKGVTLVTHKKVTRRYLPEFQRRQLKSFRRDIFSYLFHKVERPIRCSCASCHRDVLVGEAVRCSACQGYCHKTCLVHSSAYMKVDPEGAPLCNQCNVALCSVVVKKGECVNGQMSSLKITQSDSTVEKYYGCPIPFPAVLSPGVQSKTRPRASKSEPRHRRSVFLNHGLVWKRKNDVESGEQFRLRHIIPRGGGDSDPLRRPICTLCFKDYNPSAVYIRCEKCSHWVHADAVLLEEDQMSNLIGYKCCKCRRKSSPRCPYEDPNYKKPERSQSGVALSWSQGELQLPKPIGVGQVHHLSSVNGVGSVAEVMLVAAEQGLDFRVSPGRTCPERVHPVAEDQISEAYAFYPAQEAPRPPFSQQRGSSTPGMAFCSVEDASAAHLGNQLLNSAGVKLEDMESEPPQTYFSFTELLASEDDHLDELLDMPIGNVSGSWAEANADARIVPQGMAMDTDAGKGMEEPVASLPAVGDVPCQRCGSSDPPGDLTCETCGLSVHRACAPWTAAADTSAGGQWKCVGCRDWE